MRHIVRHTRRDFRDGIRHVVYAAGVLGAAGSATFLFAGCTSKAGRNGDSAGDSAAAASAVVGQSYGVLAITHVNVIDVAAKNAAALADQTVLVSNGRITAVGGSSDVKLPPGAQLLDGRGQYLIPGLWDAHAHVTGGGEAALASFVANGVTSVRDLGGRLPELFAWRREIRAGSRIGPRLLVAGPVIEGAWWLDAVTNFLASDSALGSYPFLERSPRLRLAAATDAPAVIDSLVRLGVDVVKFRNLRGDEFRAIAAAAKRHALPLVGHAPSGISIDEAAAAGLTSLEHAETVMLRMDDAPDAQRRAMLTRVAQIGTAITPTLVADYAYRQTPDSIAYAVIADTANVRDPRRRYVSSELLGLWKFGLDVKRAEGASTPASWKESRQRQVADTRRALQAGVPLLVGTDFGVSLVYPGFSVHDELQSLVEEAGLTPLEALRGATSTPARVMGMSDSLGVIAPGQVADLVLLSADPLRDITNTKRIRAVVLGGRLLREDDLARLLEQGARSARNPERPLAASQK